MHSHNETIIGLNRSKIALGILGALAFVAVGIWLITLDDSRIVSSSSFRLFRNEPMYAHGLGYISIAFFGTVGLVLIRKLFDKKPGLVFSADGITDNSSGVSAGFIPWEDIVGSQIFEISGQQMLIILVRDPEKYVRRGNALRRKLNAANYKMSGSPISINTRTLKLTFGGLVSLFDRYYQQYGGPTREHPEISQGGPPIDH